MARFALRAILLLIGLAILVGGVFAWTYAQFVRPGPLQFQTTVVVPRGGGLSGIARNLTESGVISNPDIFRLGAIFMGADKSLRAGEYKFQAKISPREVVALLQSGWTVVRRITIAEGLTSDQVVSRLASAGGLVGAPEGIPPEGTLLPETYHFSFGDSRVDLLKRMSAGMEAMVAEIWALRSSGIAPSGFPLASAREMVILASIVERETAVASERPRIAGVFLNRLNRKMRLQSDPTVAYGLMMKNGPLGRSLTRRDLKIPTPYNTYTIDHLPPGPISNPGRESLLAVVNPAKTDELYFVADGSGGHVFARTLAEHNRNVARWRKFNRRRKQR